MGMASSQARLLSLTARLSDLEYQAQVLSNAKIRLADSSSDVARRYQEALDAQKLTVKNADASAYIDATAYNLTTYNITSGTQRILTNSAGQVMVSQDVANAFEMQKSRGGLIQQQYDKEKENVGLANIGALLIILFGGKADVKEAYLKNKKSELGNDYNEAYWSKIYDIVTADYNNKNIGKEYLLNSMGYTSDTSEDSMDSDGNGLKYNKAAINYYDRLFEEMAKNGYEVIDSGKMNDSQWLYNQLESGNAFIAQWKSGVEKDGSDGFSSVSWSSGDANLLTRQDNSQIAKAEAEYETEMSKIQAKDKRFDLSLKQIDTEHNAVQTQMESVQKVLNKNIERSFKIFEA